MFLLISWKIEFQNIGAIFLSSGEQNSSLCIVYCFGFPQNISNRRNSGEFLISDMLPASVFTGLNSVKHYWRMVWFCYALWVKAKDDLFLLLVLFKTVAGETLDWNFMFSQTLIQTLTSCITKWNLCSDPHLTGMWTWVYFLRII